MIAAALAVAIAICLLALVKPAQGAVKLPSGFKLSPVVGHVDNGTDMEVAPDGRLFVNNQRGQVRIVKPGKKFVTFLDISAKVDDSSERGLMEIAFDPKFSKNHYVYLYYTMKATSKTPAHNRVVRVTAKGDKAVPGSERLILRLPKLKTERHMGGSLEFGKDGKLYISVGENNLGNPAQSLKSNLGKILRINKDGTIPTDNPFYKKTSANNRAIWALGFRLAAGQGKLAVRILKRRGAEIPQPILLDLARAPGAPLYPLPHGLPGAWRSSVSIPRGRRHGARPPHRKAS